MADFVRELTCWPHVSLLSIVICEAEKLERLSHLEGTAVDGDTGRGEGV